MKLGILLGLLSLCLAPPALTEENPWLKGYAKMNGGETIGYHSPYPDATAALLVRATDGTASIEWESEPVPQDFGRPFATFVWMAGLATQKGAHQFFLSVDGRPLVTFRTGKDSSEKEWTIAGNGGASLRFTATLVDQFQELFGFMFLKIPRSMIVPGKPLRFKVVGENGGSRDWFMVFQYDLKNWMRVVGEPALLRLENRLCQPIRVEISHFAPPAAALISAQGGGSRTIRLATGYNVVYFPVDAVSIEKDIQIGAAIEGRPEQKESVRIRPVARREIYLLPHSHVDIGYSDPQAVVEKNHWKYFEEAIELARRTQDYPPGARFKWNVEVLWAVETYLKQATAEKREAFLAAVKKGWIGLQALLANELSGICHPEELYHLTEFARRLSAQYGIPVRSAMITDIPSYTWSIVPALAQSGIKYFSSGPNYVPILPDGGDRIGTAMTSQADKPFYWVAPSGKEKVLFWMAGRGYSWFHGLNMGSLSLDKRQPIFDYLRGLAERGYPYDMIQVRYTTGGDNGPPDPGLSDFVKNWNEEYESPKFVIATSEEMFEEFERRSGSSLPSMRGDFTPYWEDGAGSTALETAMNRGSVNRLLQAETLWSLLDPAGFPAEDFYEAWRQALLWDEHTWGAADSVSDPDGANAAGQWAYKQALALEAGRRSKDLWNRAVAKIQKKDVKSGVFEVLNTNSWEATDVILIPGGQSTAGDRIRDDAGKIIPSQRLSSGELAFLAERIPPFGARRYVLMPGSALKSEGARAEADILENSLISVALDPRTGAIRSFKLKSGGVEFVDQASGRGLNDYLYVPGRDPEKARGIESVRMTVKETGPLVASIVVESNAPGANSLKREIRIYGSDDRIDIDDLIDKKSVRDKESVHIAFPFQLIGGEVRVNLGWSWIRPDADQIPGSCKDYFCVQNALDISNAKRGIALFCLDAPLVEIGQMTDETPAEKNIRTWRKNAGPSQTIYSYVMNNYWHTNYKADQEGPVLTRYRLLPHGPFDAAGIEKSSLERSRPLVVTAVEATSPGARFPFRILSPEILVTSLKPSADGKGWVARLYNPTSKASEARLLTNDGSAIVFYRSDPFETKGTRREGRIRLGPMENATIRIER